MLSHEGHSARLGVLINVFLQSSAITVLSMCAAVGHTKSRSVRHIDSLLLILHKDLVRNTIISYFYDTRNKLKLQVLYPFHQHSSEPATIQFSLGATRLFSTGSDTPAAHGDCYTDGSISCGWTHGNHPPLSRKKPLLPEHNMPRDGSGRT